MGPASIKLYDKQGLVLRIETTVNDVTFFKHYRTVEHRDGTNEKKTTSMQKTIYSIPALIECMTASNRRYLEFISEIADPSAGLKDVDRLSETVKKDGRSFPGFNLFSGNDLEIVLALLRGEYNISRFTNKQLRKVLRYKTSAQISRILKRLRIHGLIKKVGRTFKYYITSLGRRTLLTGLKLELVVIPSLADANAI